jgi:hypothetical protein
VNLRSQPYRSLRNWTLICLVPVLALIVWVAASPSYEGCFEWCDVPALIATFAITWISVAWLVGILIVAWRWRHRAPALAVVAALGAGVLSLVQEADIYLRADYPPEVVSVVILGLTLPPVWRLAASARPAGVGRLAAAATLLSTLVSSFALLILGTSIYNSTFDVSALLLDISGIAFSAGLTVLAASCWQGHRDERPGLAMLAAGSILGIVIVVLYRLVPYNGGEITFFNPLPFGPVIELPGYFLTVGAFAAPLVGVGWLWIALTWLRSSRAATAIPPEASAA